MPGKPSRSTSSPVRTRDDAADGELLVEGRTDNVITGPAGLRLWTGRAADPFYVDLTQVRVINAAVKNGAKVDLPNWRPEVAESRRSNGRFCHATISSTTASVMRLIVSREMSVP
jgi:hypothetical protein